MVHHSRMTARPEGDIVVFLIGMLIKKPWVVHKWLPVASGMLKMLGDLYRQVEEGVLSHEMWSSRTILVVQYWKNVGLLMDYATAKTARHVAAWQRFRRAVGSRNRWQCRHLGRNLPGAGRRV